MPLRVVHVVVAGDIGGAERLLVDLAGARALAGPDDVTHSVALMTPNPKLRAYFEGGGVTLDDRGKVRENPLAYLYRSLGPSDTAWLAGVLRAREADVAHLHTFQSHVVGTRAARQAGVPVLRTEHHVDYLFDRSTAPFTRWSLARTDLTVAISAYVARVFAEAVPEVASRIRVVRNGVDHHYFAAEKPRDAAPGAAFSFAVVCRLEPWKQVDRLIAAMALVPNAELVVVGDGSARDSLEQQARPLGARVRFVGYQKDPRPALAACDAAVNVSRDEPLGLSVLEALSTARPVLAFDGGGIPEIVHDEVTGWLVRERTAEALTARLRAAAGDRPRAASMGLAARAFVEAECGIEAMREGYRKAYIELQAARVFATPSASAGVTRGRP